MSSGTSSGTNGGVATTTTTNDLPEFPSGGIEIIETNNDSTRIIFAIHYEKFHSPATNDGSTTLVSYMSIGYHDSITGKKLCTTQTSLDVINNSSPKIVFENIPCYGGFTDVSITVPIGYENNDEPPPPSDGEGCDIVVVNEEEESVHPKTAHYDIQLSCVPT